jgi:hypothetical protein
VTVFALLLTLVLAPLGVCAVVCAVGWWATLKPRLEHQQKMFQLSENAKLNALTITERQIALITRDGDGSKDPQ